MKEIFRFVAMSNVLRFGAIAQLVEHLHGMQGASGSSPLGSIKISSNDTNKLEWFYTILYSVFLCLNKY